MGNAISVQSNESFKVLLVETETKESDDSQSCDLQEVRSVWWSVWSVALEIQGTTGNKSR